MLSLCNDFNDHDRHLIKEFIRLAEELESRKLLEKEKFPIRFNEQFDTTSGTVKWTIEGPDEDLLRSALLDVRNLVADGSKVRLEQVLNILIKNSRGTAFVKEIHAIREDYLRALSEGPSGMKFMGGPSMEPRKILNLLFNAEYFHRDLEKIEELLTHYHGLEMETRILFLYGVQEVIAHAMMCLGFIRKNLDQS